MLQFKTYSPKSHTFKDTTRDSTTSGVPSAPPIAPVSIPQSLQHPSVPTPIRRAPLPYPRWRLPHTGHIQDNYIGNQWIPLEDDKTAEGWADWHDDPDFVPFYDDPEFTLFS